MKTTRFGLAKKIQLVARGCKKYTWVQFAPTIRCKKKKWTGRKISSGEHDDLKRMIQRRTQAVKKGPGRSKKRITSLGRLQRGRNCDVKTKKKEKESDPRRTITQGQT